MWSSCVVVAGCLGLAVAVWAVRAVAAEALTNDDVVRLTEAGLAPVAIIAKIESSAGAFDTSVDALVALADSGVDSEVIAAMVAAEGVGVPRASEQPQRRAGPGSTFRESLRGGGEGPEMVVIPAGRFRMGCLSNADCRDRERPVHEVTIAQPFALSVHEVTFEDYDRFTYPQKVDDRGYGRGRRPVINVSWNDAQDYAEWLSAQTGAAYRLPSEAEWEYAARAGTATKYHWGNEIGAKRANCKDWGDLGSCGDRFDRSAPAGSFQANGFGLYDMHGNVWEWVADCWNRGYAGAPADGSVWLRGDCSVRVLRGGSYIDPPGDLRAASRVGLPADKRYSVGFRIARTLTP